MPTTLPEHTVDIWLAAYLNRRFPGIRMWAPTQSAKIDYDLAAAIPSLPDGKVVVFENKAPFTNKSASSAHRLSIAVTTRHQQLVRYCTDPVLRECVVYVLPTPPFAPHLSADRLVPTEASHRVGPIGCDKWFQTVTPTELWNWLAASRPGMAAGPTVGSTRLPGDVSFYCDELAAHGPAGLQSLERLVDDVASCVGPGVYIRGGRAFRPDLAAPEFDLPGLGRFKSRSARVVFIPGDQMPGW